MTQNKWRSAAGLALITAILSACASPAQTPIVVTSAPQVVTQIVEGTPVQVVVTVTPEPTANPYDENAPVTVWIDG